MTDNQRSGKEEDDDLVTERDIDEQFGLFKEHTFPGALTREEQQASLGHAVPDRRRIDRDQSHKGADHDDQPV